MKTKGALPPIAHDTTRQSAYLLTCQEAAFLDWLITKQLQTEVLKPFGYSSKDICKEIGIKRPTFERIRHHFKQMGILQTEVRSISVMGGGKVTFYKLILPNLIQNLHLFIEEESSVYNELKTYLTAIEKRVTEDKTRTNKRH